MPPPELAPSSFDQLHAELREALEAKHGPLLGGRTLVTSLGHNTSASLRQAQKRGQVSVSLFNLPHRRGYFALTNDVAAWLARARLSGAAESKKGQPIETH